MSAQSNKNHVKFYPPHHFVLLPILLMLQIFAVWKIFQNESNQLVWILFAVCIFLIAYVAVMTRQHYALGNQDRIIMLEFRQRYFEIFGKRSDDVFVRLKFEQIAALRFAYDEEFKTLVERTLAENLSGKEIKNAITRWKPDNHRL